jgi:hypothetical protein
MFNMFYSEVQFSIYLEKEVVSKVKMKGFGIE